MKKALLLALICGSLVLTGCFEKKQSTTQDTNNQGGNIENQNGEGKTKYSFKDLLESKKDMKCVFTTGGATGTQKMTIYVDGSTGKMRMDATMQMKGLSGDQRTISMNSIVDKNYNYSWGDISNGKGFKATMQMTGESITQKLDMDCEDWTKDSSKFDIPKNIEFQDMDSMIKNMQKTAPTTKK